MSSIREANGIFIGYNVPVASGVGGGGGGGGLASKSPFPIIVYCVSYNYYRPHLSHFLGKCNFHDPNLVTFNLCVYLTLNEEQFTFHLQYKHSMVHLLLNRQCEELSYPQNLKMCDPILVTPLKTQPHYS